MLEVVKEEDHIKDRIGEKRKVIAREREGLEEQHRC